ACVARLEMSEGTLLAIALATPLALLAACLWKWARERVPSLLVLAPLPAFVAAWLGAGGARGGFSPGVLRLRLALDPTGGVLVDPGALLWATAGAYAGIYLRDKPNRGRFVVWWLMTLVGNLGTFLVADLAGFYLFFTVASLAAYGLVAFDETPEAKRAAGLYCGLAVLCEGFFPLALWVLAPNGSAPR